MFIITKVKMNYHRKQEGSLESICAVDYSIHSNPAIPGDSKKKYRTGPFKALAASLIFAVLFGCGSQEEYLNKKGWYKVQKVIETYEKKRIYDSIGKPGKDEEGDAKKAEDDAELVLADYLKDEHDAGDLRVIVLEDRYAVINSGGVKVMDFDCSGKGDKTYIVVNEFNPDSSVSNYIDGVIKKEKGEHNLGWTGKAKDLGEKVIETGKTVGEKIGEFDQKHDVSGKVERGAKKAYKAGKGAGKKVADGIGDLLKGDNNKDKKEEQ